jgi:hypothetical protein
MNHIGDTNKMVSDTPISDSTPHNVADLGMLCRRLERELNAANQIGRKYEDRNFAALDRIKRLEEAGDGMRIWITVIRGYLPECTNIWRKAKEAKL